MCLCRLACIPVASGIRRLNGVESARSSPRTRRVYSPSSLSDPVRVWCGWVLSCSSRRSIPLSKDHHRCPALLAWSWGPMRSPPPMRSVLRGPADHRGDASSAAGQVLGDALVVSTAVRSSGNREGDCGPSVSTGCSGGGMKRSISPSTQNWSGRSRMSSDHLALPGNAIVNVCTRSPRSRRRGEPRGCAPVT